MINYNAHEITHHRGIKINWDKDHDSRILLWLDTFPNTVIKKIAEIGEEEAFIDMVLYEPHTKLEILSDIGADKNNGIEIYDIYGKWLDYWCVNDVTTINTPYQNYLMSSEWKDKSKQFKSKNDGVCSLCNNWVGIENLQTHHIHYPKDLKNDNEKNWIAICRTCHKKLHGQV